MNICFGTNFCCKDWSIIMSMNLPNVFYFDIQSPKLEKFIEKNNIKYVVPLSYDDAIHLSNINLDVSYNIIGSTSQQIASYCNKLTFITLASKHNLLSLLPTIYVIRHNEKFILNKPKEYPLIIKPIVGSNGKNMIICHNQKEFNENICLLNSCIVQKFICNLDEYSAYVLVINGIIKSKIVYKQTYQPYNIKTTFFTDCEVVEFDIDIFTKFFTMTNYTGIACIDFKIENNQVFVFEINPRAGGTIIHRGDIYKLFT